VVRLRKKGNLSRGSQPRLWNTINLTKKMKDLYNENYKSLKKKN
jgi:hypothetical protein